MRDHCERKKKTIRDFLSWVAEAKDAHQDWKAEAWNDWEYKDSVQWSEESLSRARSAGITPLTINKISPIVRQIHGYYLTNKNDIVAKGRTKEDNEISQVMSESIAYVMDANEGSFLEEMAFVDQITSGFGVLEVSYNEDIRKERVKVSYRDWYSFYWDPFASPWLSTDDCRYVFLSTWTNTSDVAAAFPEHAEALESEVNGLLTGDSYDSFESDIDDNVEDYRRVLTSTEWLDAGTTKRIKVVELWYTQYEMRTFVINNDGSVTDITEICEMNPVYAYDVIQESLEVVTANVKKMRVATFVGELLLQDIRSPYDHDEFPFVPYVGYLDRYKLPYGVPRQLKGQNDEVNKRRSMAIAALTSKRVLVEKGALEDENVAFEESMKVNPMIQLSPGGLNRLQIVDTASLSAGQVQLMEQSEREIKEISGSNDEALGNATYASQSGFAMQLKQNAISVTMASLMSNERRSQKRLGELIMSLIQSSWDSGKSLRVTDRLSGAEKFIELKSHKIDPVTGLTKITNDITQGRFDIVTSARPMTDTMREKNINLILSAINSAPSTAVLPLLNLALLLSDIPNKDSVLKQISAASGIDTSFDDMTESEREAKLAKIEKQKAEAAAREQLMQEQEREMSLRKREAEINQINALAEDARARAESSKSNAKIKATESGTALADSFLSMKK